MTQMRGVLALLVATLLAACEPAQRTPDTTTAAADRAAIDSAHEAFLTQMRANDCNALVPLLTEDVIFAPPNTPTASGRQGFRDWCQPVFKQFRTTAVTVSNRDVDLAGDWAIEHGDFDWTVTPLAGGPEQREQGRFVAIWRRQANGSWKVARDIWNSRVPSAAPSR